jgi:hypothetical protein
MGQREMAITQGKMPVARRARRARLYFSGANDPHSSRVSGAKIGRPKEEGRPRLRSRST